MSIKEVEQKGVEILRIRCAPVVDFQAVQGVVDDLSDTINHLKTTHQFNRGIGLAAPQIGQSLRVSVVESPERQRYILINPEIIETSETKTPIREGCISFFDYRGNVPRYDRVKVKAFDKDGKEYEIEAKGNFAMLLQHELDHLDGILYFDHLPNGEVDLYLAEGSVS